MVAGRGVEGEGWKEGEGGGGGGRREGGKGVETDGRGGEKGNVHIQTTPTTFDHLQYISNPAEEDEVTN